MKYKFELELEERELHELAISILLTALTLEKADRKHDRERSEICYRLNDKINEWWKKQKKEEAN